MKLTGPSRAWIAGSVRIVESAITEGAALRTIAGAFEVLLPLSGVADVAALSARLGRDIERIGKELGTRRKKLSNAAFLERAPVDIVDKERRIEKELADRHKRLAQILSDLGLTSIRILTNNPKKIHGLQGYGLSVTEQLPIQHTPNPHNEGYLRAKADRMGHTLHHQGLNLDEEMLHGRAHPGKGSGWGEGER